MRRVVVVAWTLAVLATAPTAQADIRFGADLSVEPTIAAVLPGVGWTAAAESANAPEDGVITRWRIRAGDDPGPVRLRVLRTSIGFEIGRSAPVPAPPPNDTTTFDTRIPVLQGDRIALECCAALSEVFINLGGTTALYSPPVGDGAPLPVGPTMTAHAPAISADLEPDGDDDDYGDETQDNCPANTNPGQEDTNGDGVGNACDGDGDGVPDASDACPTTSGSLANGCPPPPPAAPRVNTPPVVRFRTPMSGTAVRARQAIELDVADDAGNPSVTLFDDDGTICSLSAPPYSCTWRPTGADVGRATLLASAVDSDNRSTLGIVRVRVARFEADLTRRVRGRQVSGRLVLPKAVEKALGCRGEVTVRRGRRTTTVALTRNCAYSARVPRGRGQVRTRFAGNPVVEAAT